MKVIIWGAGKGCKKALTVCEALNWTIIAIIDSDLQKKGAKIGKNTVDTPHILNNINEEIYVLIAASDPEIFGLAKKYTNLIIDWNTLSILYRGAAQYPDYETKSLEDKNIRNCILLNNRRTLLHRLSSYYNGRFNFAEVGVAFGDFSKEILDICKPTKLYLIDIWGGKRYKNGIKVIESNLANEIKEETVEIKRGYSFDILEQFQDTFLDIVYIDTDHTYETTWKELLICSKKVKVNGFICGHDYTKYNCFSRLDYGVYDAVNRFCVEYDYELCYLTMEKEGFHSYALRKIQ